MKKTILTRDQQDKRFQWNLKDLYENDEKWQEEKEFVLQGIQKLKQKQGSLTKSSKDLLSYFTLKDQCFQTFERLYVYANQSLHQDTTNQYYQGMAAGAQDLMTKLEEGVAFEEPELLTLSDEQWEEYKKQEPKLCIYERYMAKIMRKKAHILSPELEALLAKAGQLESIPKDIFSTFSNADLSFPPIQNEEGETIQITHGNFVKLLENKQEAIRKQAFYSVYHTYEGYKNTLATLYTSNLKKERFFSEARNFSSSLEEAMYDSEVPIEVYTNLIQTVKKHLPAMHQYVSLRKKALGKKELHMYDLYTPLVKENQAEISFETAKEMVKEGIKPLGKEYLAILEEGFLKGWIDVYENKGKRSGAYSWGAYGTHPYVLLNYQDNLNSVFTLAHEMGHAIHSYYSNETQEYVNSGYQIFVAEVASTVNESLLISDLLTKAKTQEEKVYLMNYFLEQVRGTIYRQTMFAEFEQITHEKLQQTGSLTCEEICDIYYKLNQEYYGKDIVIDKEIAMEWARIPHFYTPFYVYQYATGLSAALAISSEILSGKEGTVESYLEFLKGGGKQSPIDLLKGAGVDMTQKGPIDKALNKFGKYVKDLEEVLHLS